MAGPLAGLMKPNGSTRFIAVAIDRLERGKGRVPFLAHPTVLGLQDHDPEDSGSQRRSFFKSRKPFDDRHPGILDDLLRHFPIRHIAHRHSDQGTVVLRDQCVKHLSRTSRSLSCIFLIFNIAAFPH